MSLHPGGPGQRAMVSQLRQELVLLLVLRGKKGEGLADPTREMGSSLQSWTPSLGLTAPLFYSSPPKSCHFLQVSVACLHSDLPILPTHPCLMGTDPALPRVPDGDSAREGDTSHRQNRGLPGWSVCL